MERLLAKSTGQTLPQHTYAVLDAAKVILGEKGDRILRQFDLSADVAELHAAVTRAAVLHDLGKATKPFQDFLRRRLAPDRLPLHHELVSAWLAVNGGPIEGWLLTDVSTRTRIATLAAVCGHHLRMEAVRIPFRPGYTATVNVLAEHPDFALTLRAGEDLCGQAPKLSRVTIDLHAPGVHGLEPALLQLQHEWVRLAPDDRRFVSVVKALLVSADLLGSAMWEHTAAEVQARLRRVLDVGELAAVTDRALRGKAPRPFQQEVASAASRITLLEAGCGSGKTAAAYLWASRAAAGRRLFFCYPTTGTATEGFRTSLHKVFDEDEDPGLLLHSRALVDIAEMHHSPDWEVLDEADRYRSADIWSRPLVLCTADQVLGIMQNYRRSLYAAPVIASAAFVFDEVHLYDERMFGAFLRFLATFTEAPTLIMTATLQPERRDALLKCLNGQLSRVTGPRELEALPRYILRRVDEEETWEAVRKALAGGERVLWVANTVDRAVEVALNARRRFPTVDVLPYHSRYRYRDGILRRRGIMRAFDSSGPVLAVTTQVCEISFNLSADTLVTELCPVTSLIQRLGRLNRWAQPDDPSRPALILSPPHPAPYTASRLEAAAAWIEGHIGRPVSQADLMGTIPRESPTVWVESEWLDGGILARPAPLREPGITVEILREEDCRREWLGARGRWEVRDIVELQALAIPMLYPPVGGELHRWRRVRGVFVAPRGRIMYDEWSGARWAE